MHMVAGSVYVRVITGSNNSENSAAGMRRIIANHVSGFSTILLLTVGFMKGNIFVSMVRTSCVLKNNK